MATHMDWQELIYTRADSDVLREIHAAIDRGDLLEGLTGLEEMINLMSKREAHELRSRLAVLMAHVLKWKTQPPTASWADTIATQREEIAELRDEAPRFTRAYIVAREWEKALRKAQRWARSEMGQGPAVDTLTWEEVFEAEYRLPDDET